MADKRSNIIRFGANGWHARYSDEFTEANVVRVADALALLWADALPGAAVYVGFDTRHRSEELARTVAGVLASYGLAAKVASAPCPTPAVAWSCAHDPQAAGAVVLTASELSCEYGGIMVRGADGGPVARDFLDEVEESISAEPTDARGPFEEHDLLGAYEQALTESVDAEAIAAARPKVVVDAMYGAGTGVLADLLERVGCEVTQIHAEARDDFAGIHPEPADPWADDCEQAVVAQGAALGLLLDGDADRAAVVDEKGRILPPRVLVPLVMEHLVRTHEGAGRVVTTLSSSACVTRQAERLGLDVTAVPVGFSRIYREVQEGDVLLAAEEYGGVCVPSHLPERDGLLVCLLAVEMLVKSGLPVGVLSARLEERIGTMRYKRRDVRMESAAAQAFRNILPGLNPATLAGRSPVEVSHADGLRLQFADDSWVLMRPSRAGSMVRVYAEAETEAGRDELLDAACELVLAGI